ncbi:MAG: hypothetical protein AAF531_12405 [Actinomycetota bacterium]
MDPRFVSPQPGSDLDGAIQVFTWDLGGIPVEFTWIYAGSSLGGSDYGRRQVGADTEASLGGLPVDGSTVFVRVWYKTPAEWLFIDATYPAAGSAGLPAFVSPVSGGRLDGASHRFRWTPGALRVDRWWLYLGSEESGSDLGVFRVDTLGGVPQTEFSVTVGGLPTDERTVHARLYYRTGESWYYSDHTFIAAPERVPTKEELTRELQQLVGVTADGDVGPITRAALNRNWLGRPASFDPSFAARFTNDPDLIRWVQGRVVARGGPDGGVSGVFDTATETAVVAHLDRGGVVAVESYLTLLDRPTIS